MEWVGLFQLKSFGSRCHEAKAKDLGVCMDASLRKRWKLFEWWRGHLVSLFQSGKAPPFHPPGLKRVQVVVESDDFPIIEAA